MTTGTSTNGDSAILRFGDGKLNPLGSSVRRFIHTKLEEWRNDPSIHSVVLLGSGSSHFSAGADMTEFSNPSSIDAINLSDLCHYIESYPKPVVAALRGVALGGGLELALACSYRVATPSAQLGLPEVQVGVIPGAGGTQRLPRLVGIEQALSMILRGKPISGQQAFQTRLVDGVADDSGTSSSLLHAARQWSSWSRLMPLPRVSQLPLDRSFVRSVCDEVAKTLPAPEFGGRGVRAALRAVRASPDLPAGFETESQLFYECLADPQGQARRHAFFATRRAQKGSQNENSGVQNSSPLLKPSPEITVGVVGAGLMGSGIALVLLQTSFTVRLVDINEKALQKGVQFLQATVGSYVKRGKWTQDKAQQLLKRLKASTSLQDMKDCHLVVEAVVENMKIKQQVFKTLGQVTPPSALLLSNTSTLDIDAIASVLTSRRGQFAGWHFFSPAHKMQLVEIVVGSLPSTTSPRTVAILRHLTKRIGKIGVAVGNCNGFVGNRMLQPYSAEAVFLLAEAAASVREVDRAIGKLHGMALGPFQMSDLAGNDIGYYIRKEKGLTRDPETQRVGPNRGKTMRYTELADDMVTKLGRLGQKAGKGWYDYDPKIGKGRKGIPSKEMSDFIQKYVPPTAAATAKPLPPDKIIERCLFGLVNEGFKILEEGMAQRPSDIDVVYLYGYGWPAWRGGPMYWADNEVGLEYLLTTLRRFYQQFPGSEYFKPSKLLETCVAMGVTVEEYYKQKKPKSKL